MALVDIPVGENGETIQVQVIPPRNYFVEAENQYNIEETTDGDTVTVQWTTNFEFQYIDGEKNDEPFLDPKGTIFVLHGYGATKEHLLPLGLIMAENGYQIVLLDPRGHGRSSGKEISFGLKEIPDLKKVLTYIQSTMSGFEKVGVLGFSYGSVMAL